jgi:hypothetical protein
MFEDKRTPAINNQPSQSSDEGKSVDDKIPSGGPAVSPTPETSQKKQEPEDIFGQLDSEKKPETTQAPSDEPTIKTPPSVFTPIDKIRKKETPPVKTTPTDDLKSAMPQAKPVAPIEPPESSATPPSLPPEIPKPKLDRKNVILLLVIIALAIGLTALGIWWFSSRQASPEQETPAVLELFDQEQTMPQNENANLPGISLPTSSPSDNLAGQPQDTDGDGLTDEEEILLGTSINSADTDNDGLYDKEEVKIYKTDPLRADSDNDGWSDGEEIQKHQDPLVADNTAPELENTYLNTQFKLRFTYLDNLVLESATNDILQFNDNINQIKLYIYLAGAEPSALTPDISYQIGEDESGKLIIQSSQAHADQTPNSTDFSTQSYESKNGLSYLIRYLATKKSPDHQGNFERLLSSFIFLQ